MTKPEEPPPLRQQVEFSGAWELAFDDNLRGLENGWHTGRWPVGAGNPIQVPGIWNLAYPNKEGVGFYKTTFECPPDWQEKTVYLHFEGSCYFTQAWVNGQYVGSHEGAYTPFNFDITAYIKPGAENNLVVRVASLSKTRAIDGLKLNETPASKQSWYYTFGGLWGKVYLELNPQVCIRQVKISPDLRNQRIQVDVAICNHLPDSRACKLQVGVISPDGLQVADHNYRMTTLQGTKIYSFTIPVQQPLAWSCKTPHLYRLHTTLITEGGDSDSFEIHFGMRDFSVHEGQFYLNGEPFYIRGVLLQPDFPQTLIVPPDPRMMEKEIQLVKDAGFNLLRIHIRPAAPGFLDLADKMGILIYAETSLAWIKDSPRLNEHGLREVSELIKRDYNHPSIVFWGIYNENPTISAINGAAMLNYARTLDPTRVIVQNSGGSMAIDQDFGWIDRSYVLPERQVQPQKNIDIHLYLGGILPKPVLKWMSTLGSGAIPSSRLVEGKLGIKSVLEEFDRELRTYQGKIFLSEIGCGGIADLDSCVSYYGEHESLQDACDLRRLRDELRQGFVERRLDRIFGSLKNMVNQIQDLQALGETQQIEAVLVNPNISGFGITQLSDVAWECHAGILDIWGNPKPVYHSLCRLNKPHCLILYTSSSVVSTRNTLSVNLTLVNQEPILDEAQIQFYLINSQGDRIQSILLPAVGETGIHTYQEIQLTLQDPGNYQLSARLFTENGTLAETSTHALALLPESPSQWVQKFCSVGSWAPIFGGNAAPGNYLSRQDREFPILAALPSTLTVTDWEDVVNAVQQGRTVIVGALTTDDQLATEMLSRLGVNIRLSPGIGSWIGCYHWLPSSKLFKGLPAGGIAGEVYVDVLPHYVLDEMGGEVLSGSFRTTWNRDQQKHVLWYSNVESIAISTGRIIFCQQRIFNQNPDHPIALQLTNNLLQMVVENDV